MVSDYVRRTGLFDPRQLREPSQWGSHADSFWLAILLCGIVTVLSIVLSGHPR